MRTTARLFMAGFALLAICSCGVERRLISRALDEATKLTPEQARQALLEGIRLHPDRFPYSDEESVQRLRDAPVRPVDVESVEIWRFHVNLRGAWYETPPPRDPPPKGSGRGHSIEWHGRFVRNGNWRWMAEPPKEIHVWHE
jgi:hypothetical protein